MKYYYGALWQLHPNTWKHDLKNKKVTAVSVAASVFYVKQIIDRKRFKINAISYSWKCFCRWINNLLFYKKIFTKPTLPIFDLPAHQQNSVPEQLRTTFGPEHKQPVQKWQNYLTVKMQFMINTK